MKKEPKGANKNCNSINNYHCKYCDVYTSKLSNFKRHLMTAKHKKKSQNENILKKKEPKKSQNNNIECSCGRKFKTRSGLWKHSKKCVQSAPNSVSKMFPNVSKMFPNVSKMET